MSMEVIATEALTLAPSIGLPSDPMTVSVSEFLRRALGMSGVITAVTLEIDTGAADIAGTVSGGVAAGICEARGPGAAAWFGISIPAIELGADEGLPPMSIVFIMPFMRDGRKRR